MCCNCCSARQRKIWIITIGILCVVLGVAFITLWPTASDAIANSYLPLSPNSWMFNKWLHPPTITYMYVYLFNWTNVHEATNHNVKPNFTPHGPYVFREERSKEDIIWHDNDTMTYYNRRTWFYEEEMSSGSLDDAITLPHPPSVIAAQQVKNTNRYVQKIVNYMLKTEGGMLAANKKAEEWIFKGYYDPLTELAVLFLSELLPFRLKKFGLLIGRNASKTYEGTYTIKTGQRNVSLLGELTKWRGKNQSSAFEGECGRINGSTGDIFSPRRNPHDAVSVFLPDTCRSINLYPREELSLRNIKAVRYAANDMTFDTGQLYPNMKCFCLENNRTDCPPTGVIDLGPCLYGVPFYLSQPHFLNAHPSYTSAITGMTPDPKEHEFYMIIEPSLGVPLNGNANMQINMLVQPDDSIEMFKDVNEFYAPLIMLSERGDLDESFASLVRLYQKSPAIGLGCGIAFLVIGIALLGTAIYLTCTDKWKGDRKADYVPEK